MDWLLLPFATESMIEEVTKVAKGHFIGDPSYVYEENIHSQEGRDEERKEVVSLITVVF